MTTTVIISVLTILAMAVGFAFGRNYEAERRRPKPPSAVLDLHPSEWERTA